MIRLGILILTFFIISCGSPNEPTKPITSVLRGDLNLNDYQYEIADAVLYSNYLVSGNEVFTKGFLKQYKASDVNNDGVYVTAEDLMYMVKIIVGEAEPYE
ncbi:MAG: hypothetical protein DWP97_00310 [Calditrichaeota bacterium]|nr:MAG: hypothetical protein DWP97_00310 [Calditrichota bacterium]